MKTSGIAMFQVHIISLHWIVIKWFCVPAGKSPQTSLGSGRVIIWMTYKSHEFINLSFYWAKKQMAVIILKCHVVLLVIVCWVFIAQLIVWIDIEKAVVLVSFKHGSKEIFEFGQHWGWKNWEPNEHSWRCSDHLICLSCVKTKVGKVCMSSMWY